MTDTRSASTVRAVVGLSLCIAATCLLLLDTGLFGLVFYLFELPASPGTGFSAYSLNFTFRLDFLYWLLAISMLIETAGVVMILGSVKRSGHRTLCIAYFLPMLIGSGILLFGIFNREGYDLDQHITLILSILMFNIACSLPVLRLAPLPITMGALCGNVLATIMLFISNSRTGASGWLEEHLVPLALLACCVLQAVLVISMLLALVMRKRYLDKAINPEKKDDSQLPPIEIIN